MEEQTADTATQMDYKKYNAQQQKPDTRVHALCLHLWAVLEQAKQSLSMVTTIRKMAAFPVWGEKQSGDL